MHTCFLRTMDDRDVAKKALEQMTSRVQWYVRQVEKHLDDCTLEQKVRVFDTLQQL